MDLTIKPLAEDQRKQPPADMSNIGFGSCFTNHMFTMDYTHEQGWHNAVIEGYHTLELDPSSIIFHYGQEAFEGLKAYHAADGRDVLFRPMMNFERLNRTADRMCLPQLDTGFLLKSLKELLKLDRDWIPKQSGTSLYIRPTVIATEAALGLKSSNRFLLFIIMCPVGSYYKEGFNPVKIIVSDKYTRAAPGGVGEAKTAGNYAASVKAEKEAKDQGFTQVLWLDAVERKYVEEVGSMNIFFVIDDELVTPQLTGTILPGVTRDSVLQLARHWGMKVSERRISIDELIESIKQQRLKEIFGSGTAAVISPVGLLQYKGESYTIGDGQTGAVAQKFFDNIVGIQYGNRKDEFGWIQSIDE